MIGQTDFGYGGSGTGAGQFDNCAQAVCDATGRLWVADRGNGRILRFPLAQPGLAMAQHNATTLRFTCENLTRGVTYAWQWSPDFQTWTTRNVLTPLENGDMTFLAPSLADPRLFFRLLEQ